MDFTRLTAGPDDADRRLDVVLRRILPPETGLSRIYKALRCGLVKVNGKNAAPATRLHSGNELLVADFLVRKEASGTKKAERGDCMRRVHTPPLRGVIKGMYPETDTLPKQPYPGRSAAGLVDIQVLFQNEHLCILNKPAGVSSQAQELRDFLVSREDVNRVPSLAFVCAPLHRLDRRTTGVLVCSQSIEGARWFSAALKNHLIGKTYLGITEGRPDAPVRWEDTIAAKAAVTHAAPLSHGTFAGRPVTLVSFVISTGRRHQIRAQCQIHGIPLLGDVAYGGGGIGTPHFLHALCVTFPLDNPLSLPETVEAPLPERWEVMLRDCGLKAGRAP